MQPAGMAADGFEAFGAVLAEQGGGAACAERLTGLDGSFDSIISNDFVDSGQAVVEIAATDIGFASDGCGRGSLCREVPGRAARPR